MKKNIIIFFLMVILGAVGCMNKPQEPKAGGGVVDPCAKIKSISVLKAACDPGGDYTPPSVKIDYVNQSFWDLWNNIKGALDADGMPRGYFEYYINGTKWQSYTTLTFYGDTYLLSEANALKTALINEYNNTGKPDAKTYAGELELKLKTSYEASYNCYITLNPDDPQQLLTVRSEKLVPLVPGHNFILWMNNFNTDQLKNNLLLDRNSPQLKFEFRKSGVTSYYSTINQTSSMILWVEKVCDIGEDSELRVGELQNALLFKATGPESQSLNGVIYPYRISE